MNRHIIGKRYIFILILLILIPFYIGLDTPAKGVSTLYRDGDVYYSSKFDPMFLKPSPKIGELNVAVLFIDFTNYHNQSPISEVKVKISKVDSYFTEVSYGLVWLNILYIDMWLTLNNTREYYGEDLGSDIDVRWYEFVNDSLAAGDPYIDYRGIDYVFLVHAGDDQAYSGDPYDLWSSATLGKWPFDLDGGVYIGVMVVAEFDPAGVYVHEFGHNLGLPDLYDYTYQTEFVGIWSLMDTGSWVDPPSSLMAPEKSWLGWINESTRIVVGRGEMGELLLYPLERFGDTLMIMLPIGDVYYSLEYRRKIGTDYLLPSEGVLISIVNESLDSGEGIIRVIDGNPDTESLGDAPFTMGDMYVDYELEVFIQVSFLNSSFAKVLVKNGLPDLYINGVWNETLGGQMKLYASVVNGGSGPSEPFYIFLFYDNEFYDKVYVDQVLAPGSELIVSFENISVSSGEHIIEIVVDYGDVVVERDEGNNVYSLSYYLSPRYVLDKYVVSDDRVDVGSLQSVKMHFIYYSNGSVYANKPVYINGTMYITDSDGWVSIDASLDRVGRLTWVVTEWDGYQLVYPYIIWDMVNVTLYVVDDRIDVNTTGLIYWEARYVYDDTFFEGSILLNDTLYKDRVGLYWYTVASINDSLYGLSIYESNSVYIIFDMVNITLDVVDSRINVGSMANITFTAVYMYDDTPFVGNILINSSFVKNEVGLYWYTVENVSDKLYGLTRFVSNRVYVIFDKVIINLTPVDDRVDVGSEAGIEIDAYYSYDGSPYDGDIILNDSLVKDIVGMYWYGVDRIGNDSYGITVYESNSVSIVFDMVIIELSPVFDRYEVGDTANISIRAYYAFDGEEFVGTVFLNDSLNKLDVGIFWYGVQGISDPLYGLSSFESNSIPIIFDRLSMEVDIDSLIPYLLKLRVYVYSEYEDAFIRDAQVMVDGESMELVGDSYVSVKRTLNPFESVTIYVMYGGIEISEEVDIVGIGNILLFTSIVVSMIIILILLRRRRS